MDESAAILIGVACSPAIEGVSQDRLSLSALRLKEDYRKQLQEKDREIADLKAQIEQLRFQILVGE